ncbi:zinc ribbon domain-containing protein [Picosynechococcus sp. NKBG15041c]
MLDVRARTCQHCGTAHDQDINGSINIRNEGWQILSLGTSDTA